MRAQIAIGIAIALIVPFTTSAADFAYRREIVIPAIPKETSVWVPLDPHALAARTRGFAITDGAGVPIPFKQLNESRNLLTDAIIESAPQSAPTAPPTEIRDMIDGNPETAFQPKISTEVVFRFRLTTPSTPTHLTFQLASGWVEHIRVRLGSSNADLHDAFVGTPRGTSIALSGEVATVVEITVRTNQGVLRIAEAKLLAPTTRLLIRAKPSEKYTLLYGTQEGISVLSAGSVFTDINAIEASLGPISFVTDGPDADSDHVPDSLDNCRGKPNAGQTDRDGDGIGDVCDNAPGVANIGQSDQDRDGVGDGQDNCPGIHNSDQKDDELNGIGWVCDDADHDGVMNSKDNCVGLSNPDQRDLDNNNVGDACEDDRDRDGVPAAVDNCKTTKNPQQDDSDHDGIGDMCDDCIYQYDPKQIDRDGNGIGDACQQATETVAVKDADGDGVEDGKDLCPMVSDSEQFDQDDDRIGDMCDNCPALKNTDQMDGNRDGVGDTCTDSDGDGVLDPYDNCRAYANSDQNDRNQNTIGDPCDDDDGDSIENARDNCPYDSNHEQSDEDADGVGNVCDHSDDRWSEKRPWLLYGSMAVIVLALTGLGAVILKRSTKS